MYLLFSNDGRNLIFCEGDGVWTSADHGLTWTAGSLQNDFAIFQRQYEDFCEKQNKGELNMMTKKKILEDMYKIRAALVLANKLRTYVTCDMFDEVLDLTTKLILQMKEEIKKEEEHKPNPNVPPQPPSPKRDTFRGGWRPPSPSERPPGPPPPPPRPEREKSANNFIGGEVNHE